MAIIQTIRDKYAKLAGVVIVIALAGFVLMDFGSGGGGMSDTIAKVNGKKISYTEYENLIQQKEQEIKMQNPNFSMNDMVRAQLRDQVWDDIINQEMLNNLYKNLGINVSEAEINELTMGANPDPMIRQALSNPQTGEYNPQEAAQVIQQIKNDPQQQAAWDGLVNEVRERRYLSKLNALVAGSIYTPTKIAEKEVKVNHNIASGEVVVLPYSLVADSEVSVTDEDLKNFIQKNKALFTNKEEYRSVQYVSFETIPSSADTNKALERAEEIKTELEATESDKLNDFLALYSSTSSVPYTYFTEEQITTLELGEEIWAAATNEVYGPYFEDDQVWVTKTTEKVSMPADVEAQQIFVASSIQGNEVMSMTDAKQKLDSAIALINGGQSFAEIAQATSDDNLADMGGLHTFTPQDRIYLQDDYAQVLYHSPVGTKRIIEVNDEQLKGYYYVEILEKSAEVESYHKIAFINQAFNADKNTISEIYNQASKFSQQVLDGRSFEEVAQEMGVIVQDARGIRVHSQLIPGLGASSELGNWVKSAKVGETSAIVDVNQQFVIAKLSEIQPKGLMTVNDANRAMIEAEAIKEKKAEKLMATYNSAANLAAISEQSNQPIIEFENLGFNQMFIEGIGQEPKAIGYLSNASHAQKLSKGIAGNNGVIYIHVNDMQQSANPNMTVESVKMRNNQIAGQNAMQVIIDQLNKKANVKDLRHKIYR